MALARMDDHQPSGARGGEHRRGRADRAAQQAHIVAERLAEPARLEKVALHVDDQQCAFGRLEREFVRLGIDQDH